MHVCNPAQFYPIDNVFVPLLDVKTCETWAAFIVQQPQETTDVELELDTALEAGLHPFLYMLLSGA